MEGPRVSGVTRACIAISAGLLIALVVDVILTRLSSCPRQSVNPGGLAWGPACPPSDSLFLVWMPIGILFGWLAWFLTGRSGKTQNR